MMPWPVLYPIIPGESKEDRRKRLNREAHKRLRDKDPEKDREKQRKWYSTYASKCREEEPEEFERRVNSRRLRYNYNISMGEYEEMLEEQGGLCKICRGTNADGRRLTVDHNHSTNQIRGLLCTKCNLGLGHFKDSINLLEAALLYMREYENL